MCGNIENSCGFIHRFLDEYDPEETLSANEDDDESILDVTKGEEDMEISNITDAPTDDVPTKPETLHNRNERLAQEMKEIFGALEGLGNHSGMFHEHFKRERVIADVPLLLKTFNSGCTHLSCLGTSKVLHSKMSGGVLTVS